MAQDKDLINQMITDCMNRESRMSDWERGFIDSIGVQMGNGKTLTQKQEETLNTIWDKVTANG